MTVATTTFTATRAAFDAAFAKQTVGGASLSATVEGVEVLTLTAGEARPGVPWAADTRTVTMSVAKGWAGLVVAMLADRGLLDPEERVAAYWPEFAANGKQGITVRQVLLHTAGVLGLPDVGAVLGWDGRGWEDLDPITAALAASTPAWEPGTREGYHAVTYGWLVGELVRRTDGRTLGTFFREEVAEPLGIRAAIGTPREVQHELATIHSKGMDAAPFPMSLLLGRMRKQMRDPATLLGKASLGDGVGSIFDAGDAFLASTGWLAAEVPSSNGVTSARDLARLFAAIACGGELDGYRLLSAATLDRFMQPQPGSGEDCVGASVVPAPLRSLVNKKMAVRRTLSFLANSAGDAAPLGPSPRAVGAGGYGGQFVLADPDRKVSLAFVRSELLWSVKELAAMRAAFYEDLGA